MLTDCSYDWIVMLFLSDGMTSVLSFREGRFTSRHADALSCDRILVDDSSHWAEWRELQTDWLGYLLDRACLCDQNIDLYHHHDIQNNLHKDQELQMKEANSEASEGGWNSQVTF